MTSRWHMLELLLQVTNSRIEHGSIKRYYQRICGGGDWDFQLRRSRIDSFSREQFDQFCLNVWRNGQFIFCQGQKQETLGDLKDWQTVYLYIHVYATDKQGKVHYDFLEKYVHLNQTKDWKVIHNDSNLCYVTCQNDKYYYLFSFGTS